MSALPHRRVRTLVPKHRPQPIRVIAPALTPAAEKGFILALGKEHGEIVQNLLELCRNHVLDGVWILESGLYIRIFGELQGPAKRLRWDHARDAIAELRRSAKL